MGDPYQYVKLPDGSYGKFASDATDETIKTAIAKDFPDAFKVSAKTPPAPNPMGMANQVLAKYGIRVGPPPNSNLRTGQNMELPGAMSRLLYSAAGTLPDGSGTNPDIENARKFMRGSTDLRMPFGSPSDVSNQAKALSGQIGERDLAGAVGTVGGVALQIYLMKKAGERFNAQSPPREQSPIERNAAVDKITNSFNPATEEMPSFRANLERNLDTILNQAEKKPTTLREMADVTKQAAEKSYGDYYERLIKPIADRRVGVNPRYTEVPSRYISAVESDASIAAIDRRLTEINATLNPKYLKAGAGSVESQAAIGAEQAASLRQEGAYLRDVLNRAVAKNMDIPYEEVAAARSKMGSLRSLGDSMQYYSDAATNLKNRFVNEGIRPDSRATTYLAKRGQLAYRERFGFPADKVVRSVADSYAPQSVPEINPTQLDVLNPNLPRNPAWSGIEPGRPSPNVTFVDPAPQLSEMLGRTMQRINQKNINNPINPQEQWF